MTKIPTALAGAFALALLADLGTAQTPNYFVSPTTANGVEGSSQNGFPFTNTTMRRYMQIHSDLPMTVMQITALAWRHNGGTSNYTGGKRVVDCELFMGASVPYNACSFELDKNYVGNSRKVAMKRKVVDMLGNQSATPSPFGPELKCDAPVLRLPTQHWIWEAVIYSNTSSGSFGVLDVDVGTQTQGSSTPSGTGCTTTGASGPMTQLIQNYDLAGTLMLMFSGQNYPANSPAFLLLGVSNPNLTVPGLCAPLQSDLTIGIWPIGMSQANGDLNREGSAYYYSARPGTFLFPNPGPVTLYTQIMAVDTSQPGLPFGLSHGLQIKTPAPDTTKVVKVTRLFNNTGGTTATESTIFPTSSIGHGLVTRFEY